MIRKFCLPALFLLSLEVGAEEFCGRTAIINNQEVLVDISSSSKGEGLRPYLAKDITAQSYLDQYQKQGLSQNKNVIVGSVGIGLILGGASLDSENRFYQISIGLSLLALNVLIARSLEFENENLLRKSIDEYNKRNLPSIYFLPYQSHSGRQKGPGLIAGLQVPF